MTGRRPELVAWAGSIVARRLDRSAEPGLVNDNERMAELVFRISGLA